MIELPPGKILSFFARPYHRASSYLSSFLQTPPHTVPPIVNLTIPLAFLALHFSTQNVPFTSPVRPPSTLPYPIPPAIVLLHPELHNTGRRSFNSQKGTKIQTLLFYPHLTTLCHSGNIRLSRHLRTPQSSTQSQLHDHLSYLALPVPLTFFRNTDPAKPLDLPKLPAPTGHPLHTHKIQHAPRRSVPRLPSRTHYPALLRAGRIRDNPAQSAQPHPDKRVQGWRGHHAARRRRRLRARRRDHLAERLHLPRGNGQGLASAARSDSGHADRLRSRTQRA